MKKMFPVSTSTLVLAGTVSLLASSPARASFVTNGSFEAVQITTQFSTAPADIPGWTHTGSAGDALLVHAGPQCCGGTGTALAGDGNEFVVLGGGFGPTGSAAWSQTINGLTIGQNYLVNFLIAAEGEVPTQQITVGFTSGSLTPSETFTTPVTATLFWQDWGSEQYAFVPTATSAMLQFSVTGQAYDVGVDGVSIVPQTSAPEPGSWPLVVTGLLGLGAAVTIKRRLLSFSA
jgi:hypothetical protein